jgi:hypothetical protein
VTAEHVTALHSLVERDAGTLDKTKKRVLKLANAAKLSLAGCALLEDGNQFLLKQNNEAKRRRSTKSTVVEKAKVMSSTLGFALWKGIDFLKWPHSSHNRAQLKRMMLS